MEWVKLCDVAEVIMGQSPNSEYCNDNKEGLPFYQGVSDFGEIFPVPTKYCTEPKKIAEIDDILIGVRAPVGDLNISNSNCCIGRGVAAIRANEKFISKKYLFYFLKTQKQYFEINSTGSTFKAINKSVLSETLVPIIDINKQKIIEDMLDRVENIIRKRKEQIQAYDDLIESLFSNITTFENEVILKKLIKVNPSKNEVKKLDDNLLVSFVPMEDVSENCELFLNHEKKIKDVYKGFTYFRDNDVVVAKITPCFENGKGALMKGLKNGIGFGTTEFHVLRISDLKKVNPIWLFYLTRSKKFRLYGELQMTGSAGQKRISKSFIENYKINLPPIELQNKFAEYVIKIEEEKKKLNSSLAELETLFDALMQEAFSGNLFKD